MDPAGTQKQQENIGNQWKTIEKHRKTRETTDITIETRGFEASSFYLGPRQDQKPRETQETIGQYKGTTGKHRKTLESADIKIETRGFEAPSFYLGPPGPRNSTGTQETAR